MQRMFQGAKVPRNNGTGDPNKGGIINPSLLRDSVPDPESLTLSREIGALNDIPQAAKEAEKVLGTIGRSSEGGNWRKFTRMRPPEETRPKWSNWQLRKAF